MSGGMELQMHWILVSSSVTRSPQYFGGDADYRHFKYSTAHRKIEDSSTAVSASNEIPVFIKGTMYM